MSQVCSTCFNENPDDVEFCEACGIELSPTIVATFVEEPDDLSDQVSEQEMLIQRESIKEALNNQKIYNDHFLNSDITNIFQGISEYQKHLKLLESSKALSVKKLSSYLKKSEDPITTRKIYSFYLDVLENLWQDTELNPDVVTIQEIHEKYFPETLTQVCSTCFNEIPDDIDFCEACGIELSLSPDVLKKRLDWFISMTKNFIKNIAKINQKLQERVEEAITIIAQKPLDPLGDTIKPLTGDLKGYWRYRLGDYRIIYCPEIKNKTIFLIAFLNRSDVYR